jgi:hypothetical protein
MIKKVSTKELPNIFDFFIKDLELILTGELLAGNDYGILETKKQWTITLPTSGMVYIEKPANKFRPPYIQVGEKYIKEILENNIDNFEYEIKSFGIMLFKTRKHRNGGYFTLGGNQEPHLLPIWRFTFLREGQFYNFYLICQKYKIL